MNVNLMAPTDFKTLEKKIKLQKERKESLRKIYNEKIPEVYIPPPKDITKTIKKLSNIDFNPNKNIYTENQKKIAILSELVKLNNESKNIINNKNEQIRNYTESENQKNAPLYDFLSTTVKKDNEGYIGLPEVKKVKIADILNETNIKLNSKLDTLTKLIEEKIANVIGELETDPDNPDRKITIMERLKENIRQLNNISSKLDNENDKSLVLNLLMNIYSVLYDTKMEDTKVTVEGEEPSIIEKTLKAIQPKEEKNYINPEMFKELIPKLETVNKKLAKERFQPVAGSSKGEYLPQEEQQQPIEEQQEPSVKKKKKETINPGSPLFNGKSIAELLAEKNITLNPDADQIDDNIGHIYKLLNRNTGIFFNNDITIENLSNYIDYRKEGNIIEANVENLANLIILRKIIDPLNRIFPQIIHKNSNVYGEAEELIKSQQGQVQGSGIKKSKKGKGIIYYHNPAELKRLLKIVIGTIEANNASREEVNNGFEIIDTLLKTGNMSKKEHKKYFNFFVDVMNNVK